MKTWLEHMETLGRDDRTLDRYRELLELYALPTVGGMQLKTLQPPHLSDLYAKLLREGRRDGKAGGLHPRTVGHVHRALHRMLKQGARWQLIARSPAADLELPSVPKSEMVTLTREQAGRLLKAAEPRPLMRHLVMLGVATGARLGELLALCWTDIDLEAGTVRIGWSVAVCGQHPRDRADPLLQRHQPRARHPPGPGARAGGRARRRPHPKQQAEQMAAVARRDGGKQLAADTTTRLDLRSMSKHDLRAHRDQLAGMIDAGPPDQSRLLDHATTRREQSEQRLAEATGRMEHAPARWLRRGDLARARQQHEQAEQACQVARQQADRAADRERHVRHEQQQHQAHREANPELLAEYYAVVREDKWRTRAQARAVELERPEWSRELGERPATVKGGRAWDRAVGQTVEYRQRWKVDDAERALGPEPHGKDASLEQRQARRHADRAVGRLRDLAGDRDQRPERQEATGRSHHRADRRATTPSATSAPCSRMVARPPRPQTTTSERPPRAPTASHGPRSPAPRGRARRRFARVG